MVPAEQPGAGKSIPGLRPPGAPAEQPAGAGGRHGWFWLLLFAVVTLGLAVMLVLPRLVSEPQKVTPVEAITQAATPISASVDPGTVRRQAELALQAYLQARARLELANAMQWGEAEMNKVADLAIQGDRSFAQRQFTMANERYSAALQGLEQLESERGARLAAALEAGARALNANQSEVAIQFFEAALAIEPDNDPAQTGLARAQVRTQLLRLMSAAERAEQTDDYSSAQMFLREAVQLDAAYVPASDALRRVTQLVTEGAFRDAMSRALTALDAGDLTVADTALHEAADLKPGEAVVGDVQRQLQLARQQARLTQLRRQASEKSRNEDWRTAVGLYQDALSIAPNAGFAREGLLRARDRLRLHQQLDFYLDNPDRVYSDQPLANAEQLLESAGQPPAAETRLAGKLERLQQLLSIARTPLPVTLVSDGLTNVVIYQVGRLGKFTFKQVELRPGTYTVVGSRAGYRDVRRTLTVLPGKDRPVLEIRSEEAV